jgi:hypothetical protein
MNLPIEFENKMKAFLGNEWDDFLYSYDNNRFQALRFNTLKVQSPEERMRILKYPQIKRFRGQMRHITLMRMCVRESIRIMRWGFTTYRSQVPCRRLHF